MAAALSLFIGLISLCHERLHSWVVYHVAFHPDFRERLPYNVALVELDEGPRLITNIIDDSELLQPDARVTFAGPDALVVRWRMCPADFAGSGEAQQQTLNARMMDSWIAFARTGDPSVSGPNQTWPAYDLTHRPTLVFDLESGKQRDPFGEERAACDRCSSTHCSHQRRMWNRSLRRGRLRTGH